MTEPVVSAIATQGGKSLGALIDRLLGPSFEFWGNSWRAELERKQNLRDVARKAMEKTNLDDDHGIPPRVAVDIFEKAQWAENEFVAEYLSGVLASGRTKDGKNDSAVPWTALISRLSSDQLALHWMAYACFQRRFQGEDTDFWGLLGNQLLFNIEELCSALQWPAPEISFMRLSDAAYGLEREGLIAKFSHGDGGFMSNKCNYTRGRQYNQNENYITFKLTQQGVQLLLQAVGLGQVPFGNAFNPTTSEAIEKIGDLPDLVRCVVKNDFLPID